MKKFIYYILICVLFSGCGIDVRNTNADIDAPIPSNKKLEWGLKKNLGAAPDINPGEKEILDRYNGYYIGDSSKNEVYLTFDEGYENGYTSQILDVLKRTNVPACFFVTGPYLEKEHELIMRMVNEGHIVGNHTVNHPSMPSVKDEKELEDELLTLDRRFYALTGQTMKYLRPPKGEHSERTLALSCDLGYKTVFWSIAYMDWDLKQQKGTDYVMSSILDNLHNGAVILMHAVSPDNANALESVINEVRGRGFEFKSLDSLPEK